MLLLIVRGTWRGLMIVGRRSHRNMLSPPVGVVCRTATPSHRGDRVSNRLIERKRSGE